MHVSGFYRRSIFVLRISEGCYNILGNKRFGSKMCVLIIPLDQLFA
jgi:hypothetical protein